MSNKDLYKKTFSKLKASEDAVTEVIKMKNNKKIRRFPAKKLLILAACIGTVLSTAIIANAASDGAVAVTVKRYIENDVHYCFFEINEVKEENGEELYTYKMELPEEYSGELENKHIAVWIMDKNGESENKHIALWVNDENEEFQNIDIE